MKQLADKKIEEKKRRLKELENALNFKKKRQQSNNLFKLAEKAKILNLDSINLLGAFLEIAEQAKDQRNLDRWQKKSESFFSVSTNNYAISFKSEPPTEIKQELKKSKFRWNAFRKEFYGCGDLNSLKLLLKNIDHELIEL